MSDKNIPLTEKQIVDLTDFERMNIVQFVGNVPVFGTICKLMEHEILRATEMAIAVDPKNKDEQCARLTEVHAMAAFYTRLRKRWEDELQMQFAQTKVKVATKEVKDANQELEDMVLQQGGTDAIVI